MSAFLRSAYARFVLPAPPPTRVSDPLRTHVSGEPEGAIDSARGPPWTVRTHWSRFARWELRHRLL